MIIDHTDLNDATLTALIEAFINRGDHANDGNDTNLTETVAQLKVKLDNKEIHLTFDANTESVNLLSTEDLATLAEAPIEHA